MIGPEQLIERIRLSGNLDKMPKPACGRPELEKDFELEELVCLLLSAPPAPEEKSPGRAQSDTPSGLIGNY